MNIFFLSTDPKEAAQYQCDAHVVKMTLEATQLLSNAHPQENAPYRQSHYNHPCSVWARKTFNNYHWLYKHAKALAQEYTYRYGRRHKCEDLLDGELGLTPKHLVKSMNDLLTHPALCMPSEFISPTDSVVECYRKYYRHKAKTIQRFNYTKRERPDWL